MAKTVAVVVLTEKQGPQHVDSEVEVEGLHELYRLCRDVSPERILRVSLHGAEGEVRLSFASFIPRS
jgi:hypothetical protein